MFPEPIDITIPMDNTDPRLDELAADPPEGIRIHRVPRLHPDDLTVVDGIPCTSVSRTLIDCAEVLPEDELRGCFATAERKGMLDEAEYAASRARVEWRPSLAMLDRVAVEFGLR